MVGLDETKCRWVEEQDFQLNFRLRIFPFYAALTESCLFEYALKVFFLLYKLGIKVVYDRQNGRLQER